MVSIEVVNTPLPGELVAWLWWRSRVPCGATLVTCVEYIRIGECVFGLECVCIYIYVYILCTINFGAVVLQRRE